MAWRPRDLDNTDYTPFATGIGSAVAFNTPFSKNKFGYDLPPSSMTEVQKAEVAEYHNTQCSSGNNFSWEDIKWLKKLWAPRQILIKGILRPDDARLAIKHGVDGIIVSNV